MIDVAGLSCIALAIGAIGNSAVRVASGKNRLRDWAWIVGWFMVSVALVAQGVAFLARA